MAHVPSSACENYRGKRDTAFAMAVMSLSYGGAAFGDKRRRGESWQDAIRRVRRYFVRARPR